MRKQNSNFDEIKTINRYSSVVLVPEESEDMWHAYNLIAVGDLVKASTIRKVCDRFEIKKFFQLKKLIIAGSK